MSRTKNQTCAYSYDQYGNITKSAGTGIGTSFMPMYGASTNRYSTSFLYDALGRRVDYGSGTSWTQYLYPPSNPMANLGAAYAQTAPGLRVSMPGGGQAILGSSGISDYRRRNWQGSQPIDSSKTQTALSDAAYTPFGEHYLENGYSGFFAGNLSIWPEFMDGYAATFRLYSYDQGRWISPDPAGLGGGPDQSAELEPVCVRVE